LETFGRDCSSALHIAIRNNKPLAALDLIQHGASVNAENGRAVTPMVLACQKGMYQVVQELYKRGACIQQSSHSGSTPLIQACHFGHLDIVQFLIFRGANIQTPNLHNTTPLMRAAQEGHYEICDLLLKHGAHVNCRNTEHMSALMLAAQRGHAKVCQLLIDKGRAELNATTLQSSTPLMLACKRGHAEVVQVLLTAGCELSIRDSRGRTARDTAKRRQNFALMQLLNPDVQLHLMQMSIRKVRNLEMLKLWTLLQQERAHVPLMHSVRVSIHYVHKYLRINKGSKSALIRTMTLPAPLVELIATFLPLPRLWEWRSALIVRKCTVDPDAAVAASLEIIDEVLDEGGFVHACDEAHVTPPTNFSSWVRSCCILYILFVLFCHLTKCFFGVALISANGKFGTVVPRIIMTGIRLLQMQHDNRNDIISYSRHSRDLLVLWWNQLTMLAVRRYYIRREQRQNDQTSRTFKDVVECVFYSF
jgi:ankyrin repeat protein